MSSYRKMIEQKADDYNRFFVRTEMHRFVDYRIYGDGRIVEVFRSLAGESKKELSPRAIDPWQQPLKFPVDDGEEGSYAICTWSDCVELVADIDLWHNEL